VSGAGCGVGESRLGLAAAEVVAEVGCEVGCEVVAEVGCEVVAGSESRGAGCSADARLRAWREAVVVEAVPVEEEFFFFCCTPSPPPRAHHAVSAKASPRWAGVERGWHLGVHAALRRLHHRRRFVRRLLLRLLQ
jgi:hypothetical protein